MDLTLALMLGTVAAAVLLGIVIGKAMISASLETKVQDAFRRGKDEAEVEKANLAMTLGEQLVKIREGIQQVAQAYDSTVRVVQENLLSGIDRAKLTDESTGEIQLSLDFEAHPRLPQSNPAATELTEEMVMTAERMDGVPARTETLVEAEGAGFQRNDLSTQILVDGESRADGAAQSEDKSSDDSRFRLNGGDKNVTLQ